MKDILSNPHVFSIMTSVIRRENSSLGQVAFRSWKSKQTWIFLFFLGTGMMLATQSGCCFFLTKLESMVFLTFDLISLMISGQNLHCCCLTDFASELILRWCLVACGSSLGMSSLFQAKMSIYSRMRCIRPSFSKGDRVSVMKMGLGLASFLRFILTTLPFVGSSRFQGTCLKGYLSVWPKDQCLTGSFLQSLLHLHLLDIGWKHIYRKTIEDSTDSDIWLSWWYPRRVVITDPFFRLTV